MKKGHVVPLVEKIAFGVGDMPGNLTYTALHFYFVWYIVNIAGLPVGLAGLIFGLGRIWDAFSDYIMGRITDRTKSKYGRRRPYLLFGSLPLGISFILLWVIPVEGTTPLFIYYLIVVILFNTTFTVTTVPYNALLPELTQNYNERTTLSGFKIAFSFIATLMAAAGVAVIVDNIFPGREAYRDSYPFMAYIIAGLVVIMYIFTYLYTKERIRPVDANIDTSGFFSTLKDFWKLKEFRVALTVFLFNQIGVDIFMTIVLFFLKDLMRVPEDLTFIIMGIPLVVAAVLAPFWVKISERFGKRKTLIMSSIYFAISLQLCLIAPAGNIPAIIAIAVITGIGMSASQVLPWSILPDVIEFDEYENGVRREGAFYGITTSMYKIASAVAVALATTILASFGYVENSTNHPETALLAIRILTGVGPAIFFLLTALAVHHLPITKERFDEIMKSLEKRKSNK